MKNIYLKILSIAGTFFLVVLSILAITATSFLARGTDSLNENTISVTGTSEVNAAPDIASFSFSVSEVSLNPQEAQEVISQKIVVILEGLEELSVEEDDIRTNSYSINPKYQWLRSENKQELIGYDVRQNAEVTLRDLARAPEALTLFAASGVDNLYGPNFEIEDPEALQEQARLEAIDDAKNQARRLARDLGVKLGDIVSFNEHSGGYYPQPYFARSLSMDFAEEVSVEPLLPAGENEISSQVTIVYEIR
jgi:uncharacterized protein YggE